ncbi:LysR family transcriptional regulator [Marinobacter zhejiangensis]|uniref:DNA-binding transcriptional regulator, LysR family n=1 Tax=Marinobacter zhejiangensis TaxID=488535 RepID=A0A1I4RTL7_9GAMM|nr:LysR family transcriptional regulator [Marinobacter zhejiangensis]SFM55353.1 DNA-binding transcriptional regulator, LysR family [Marinobacter zhejiangensis]
MDSNSLKAFVTIVDTGSFSEAAESLHLTQPAISKRLSSLEGLLGHQLIDRSQRQLHLTEAGSRLLPHARRILDEFHNARVALSQDNADIGGDLDIITSHHIGLHHLPSWLRRFHRLYPNVRVNLQFMESEAAYAQMRKRNAELAFVTLSDSMGADFMVYEQWSDPMAFAVGPDHPLASMDQVTLADLSQYPAVLPDASTATYRVVSRLFLEHSLILNSQMPTNYLETIKMMTSVGLGWSVIPQGMIDGSVVQIPIDQPVSRTLGAIGLTGREPSAAANALKRIVREQEQEFLYTRRSSNNEQTP